MSKDHSKTVRLSIAARAAEIIMEEGIDDYQYAKKKQLDISILVLWIVCLQMTK